MNIDDNLNITINNLEHILEMQILFTTNESVDITKIISELFEEYVLNNAIDISLPTFDQQLTLYIYNVLIAQLLCHYKCHTHYRVKLKIKRLIKKFKKKLYTKIIPYRSYRTSFIRNIIPNLSHLNSKLETLQLIPQPAQRTEEWYIFRHNLLTASAIWKVFSTQASQNQLIYEKCKPYTNFKLPPLDSPLHWGQKYEPVSAELYKKLYNTNITDFGCIKHSQYPCIGASPDGINTDITNPRFGRMLEIKNIVNRVINGIPKVEYWIQMQVQMETCDLNECDFLETKFVEYENEEQFLADGSFTYSTDNKLKGIMQLFSNNGNLHYEYAPLYISETKYKQWEEQIMNKHVNDEWIQTNYWKLEKYSNILVLRNKLWFQAALPKITELWNIIITERITGYEHRAPKKRKSITDDMTNKCLINVIKL